MIALDIDADADKLPESTSMSQALSRYINGQLIRENGLAQEDLWVQNGVIIPPQNRADQTIDMQGCYIAPGFIDLQVNGAYGVDFSLDLSKVGFVAEKLKAHGVTSFLPTVVSSPLGIYKKLLATLQDNPAVLGVHLEGPFLNYHKAGAHRQAVLEGVSDQWNIFEKIKLMTVAPEILAAQVLLPVLQEHGIVVAAGHSEASYEQAVEAFQRGIKCVTHLYNAMTSIHQRAPGMVAAALTERSVYYTLIADGWHVHPALIKLAWQAHPEGLILVSDAISALGLPDGIHSLGDQKVNVQEGKATLEGTETLAGSVMPLDQAVRNLREFTGCSIPETIASVTSRPAKLLGLQHKKGTLNYGADADLVFLDDKLNVLPQNTLAPKQ